MLIEINENQENEITRKFSDSAHKVHIIPSDNRISTGQLITKIIDLKVYAKFREIILNANISNPLVLLLQRYKALSSNIEKLKSDIKLNSNKDFYFSILEQFKYREKDFLPSEILKRINFLHKDSAKDDAIDSTIVLIRSEIINLLVRLGVETKYLLETEVAAMISTSVLQEKIALMSSEELLNLTKEIETNQDIAHVGYSLLLNNKEDDLIDLLGKNEEFLNNSYNKILEISIQLGRHKTVQFLLSALGNKADIPIFYISLVGNAIEAVTRSNKDIVLEFIKENVWNIFRYEEKLELLRMLATRSSEEVQNYSYNYLIDKQMLNIPMLSEVLLLGSSNLQKHSSFLIKQLKEFHLHIIDGIFNELYDHYITEDKGSIEEFVIKLVIELELTKEFTQEAKKNFIEQKISYISPYLKDIRKCINGKTKSAEDEHLFDFLKNLEEKNEEYVKTLPVIERVQKEGNDASLENDDNDHKPDTDDNFNQVKSILDLSEKQRNKILEIITDVNYKINLIPHDGSVTREDLVNSIINVEEFRAYRETIANLFPGNILIKLLCQRSNARNSNKLKKDINKIANNEKISVYEAIFKYCKTQGYKNTIDYYLEQFIEFQSVKSDDIYTVSNGERNFTISTKILSNKALIFYAVSEVLNLLIEIGVEPEEILLSEQASSHLTPEVLNNLFNSIPADRKEDLILKLKSSEKVEDQEKSFILEGTEIELIEFLNENSEYLINHFNESLSLAIKFGRVDVVEYILSTLSTQEIDAEFYTEFFSIVVQAFIIDIPQVSILFSRHLVWNIILPDHQVDLLKVILLRTSQENIDEFVGSLIENYLLTSDLFMSVTRNCNSINEFKQLSDKFIKFHGSIFKIMIENFIYLSSDADDNRIGVQFSNISEFSQYFDSSMKEKILRDNFSNLAPYLERVEKYVNSLPKNIKEDSGHNKLLELLLNIEQDVNTSPSVTNNTSSGNDDAPYDGSASIKTADKNENTFRFGSFNGEEVPNQSFCNVDISSVSSEVLNVKIHFGNFCTEDEKSFIRKILDDTVQRALNVVDERMEAIYHTIENMVKIVEETALKDEQEIVAPEAAAEVEQHKNLGEVVNEVASSSFLPTIIAIPYYFIQYYSYYDYSTQSLVPMPYAVNGNLKLELKWINISNRPIYSMRFMYDDNQDISFYKDVLREYEIKGEELPNISYSTIDYSITQLQPNIYCIAQFDEVSKELLFSFVVNSIAPAENAISNFFIYNNVQISEDAKEDENNSDSEGEQQSENENTTAEISASTSSDNNQNNQRNQNNLSNGVEFNNNSNATLSLLKESENPEFIIVIPGAKLSCNENITHLNDLHQQYLDFKEEVEQALEYRSKATVTVIDHSDKVQMIEEGMKFVLNIIRPPLDIDHGVQ